MVRNDNIPAEVTSLVGRACEVDAACSALTAEGARLLTVTGPPGVGKTRLALRVARQLAPSLHDGAYFVPLAPVTDPDLVLPAVAAALGLDDRSPKGLAGRIAAYLRDREMLLVLDNFEQVTGAGPKVTALLAAAPGLKVLVTSRALLRVYGEHDFPVAPLEAPDLDNLPGTEALARNEAVQLFVQRAQAARRDFRLTEENAPAIAGICARLGGLPLAIELAAARVRLFTPAAILERLQGWGQRLRFLADGPHDLPLRQQTLRGAIDWSYHLLSEAEQVLFRRMGAFVGGCTIEAMQAVCGAVEGDAVEVAGSLVDKSLLKQEEAGGEPRFNMLEIIREYALEKLEESGEGDEVRKRHALHYLAVVQEENRRLETDNYRNVQPADYDYANIRAALDWCLAARDGDRPDPELAGVALNMVSAMWNFWERRPLIVEGARQLRRALDATPDVVSVERCQAIVGLGRVSMWLEPVTALPILTRGLEMARQLGLKWLTSVALIGMGHLSNFYGDQEGARVYLEETVAIRREMRHKLGLSSALDSLGQVALSLGDHDRAEQLFTEGLALAREANDMGTVGFTLLGSGQVAMRRGNYAEARRFMLESLEVRTELGDSRGAADCLSNLAALAFAEGQDEYAALLSGAVLAACERLGISPYTSLQTGEYEGLLSEGERRLGPERFQCLHARGARLPLEQALAGSEQVEQVEQVGAGDVGWTNTGPHSHGGVTLLTSRELEVLRAVASGLTNVQAASSLAISPHTVNMHLRSIYNKLGVTSRTAATHYALVHRLIEAAPPLQAQTGS